MEAAARRTGGGGNWRALAQGVVRDARDDEVVASRHCGDAKAPAASVVAPWPCSSPVAGSPPGSDVHLFHRLTAIVGDDAADGAAAKHFNRRVGNV